MKVFVLSQKRVDKFMRASVLPMKTTTTITKEKNTKKETRMISLSYRFGKTLYSPSFRGNN